MDKKKNRKPFYKRVSFWVLLVVAVLALLIGSCVYTAAKAVKQVAEAMAAGGQSVTVETGTIRSIVSGSGSLAVADTVDITAPTGIVVDTVKVEAGDFVRQGDVLAVLNDKSILNALVEIEDNLDSIAEKLKADKKAKKADKMSALKREQIETQQAELEEKQADLLQLRENPVIIAGTDGVVSEVRMKEGEAISGSASAVTSLSSSDSTGSYSGAYGIDSLMGMQDSGGYRTKEVSVRLVSMRTGSRPAEDRVIRLASMRSSSRPAEDKDFRLTSMQEGGNTGNADTQNPADQGHTGNPAGSTAGNAGAGTPGQNAGQESADPAAGSSGNSTGSDAAGLQTGEGGNISGSAGSQTGDNGSGSSSAGSQTGDNGSGSGSAGSQTGDNGSGSSPAGSQTGENQPGSGEPGAADAEEAVRAFLKSIYTELQKLSPAAGKPAPAEAGGQGKGWQGTISWQPSPGEGGLFETGVAYTSDITLAPESGSDASEMLFMAASQYPEILTEVFGQDAAFRADGTILWRNTWPAASGENGGAQDGPGPGGADGQQDQNGETSDLSGLLGGRTGLYGYSGLSGASSALSGVSGAELSQGSWYSDSQAVVCTLEKQDKVRVSIRVDEADILLVENGQSAVVTLDAVEGKEYSGVITHVSDRASAGSGSAKYEVQITLDRAPEMRIGMSASAEITTGEAKDVPVIPMAALQQKGQETFVYTKRNEDGTLGGPVTVETGLSDSTMVEIKSGLKEGDTVYYSRTGEDDWTAMINSMMQEEQERGENGRRRPGGPRG